MLGDAIFFPRRSVDDAQWVRSALLFWNSIYFIGGAENDSALDSAISERALWDCGFFKNRPIRADKKEVMSAARDFVDIISDFGHFSDSYGLYDMMRQSERYCYAFRERSDISFESDELPITRMVESIVQAALRNGQAQTTKISGSIQRGTEGLEVDAHIADGWICSLAAVLSKSEDLPLLTNSAFAQGLAYRFSIRDLGPQKEVNHSFGTGQMVSLSMQNLNIDTSVSFQKIIDFRESRADQLVHLAAAYSSFVRSVRSAESLSELKELVETQYVKSVAPELISLKSELHRNSIASIWRGIFRGLTIGMPAASATAYFTDTSRPILVGAGIALTIADVAINARLDSSKTRDTHQYSYLLDAKMQFGLPDE